MIFILLHTTRHDLALSQAREQARIEREAWQGVMIDKLNAQLAAKQDELMSALAAERDHELDAVVTRLSASPRCFALLS